MLDHSSIVGTTRAVAARPVIAGVEGGASYRTITCAGRRPVARCRGSWRPNSPTSRVMASAAASTAGRISSRPHQRPGPHHRRVDHQTLREIGRQGGALVLWRVEYRPARGADVVEESGAGDPAGADVPDPGAGVAD